MRSRSEGYRSPSTAIFAIELSSSRSSMSRYLIRRIEETPNITLHTRTELVGLKGDRHLEGVVIRNNATGESWEGPINMFT
jgi:thioredoxin reductase (NADPH)